jgi:hypothetical protein
VRHRSKMPTATTVDVTLGWAGPVLNFQALAAPDGLQTSRTYLLYCPTTAQG